MKAPDRFDGQDSAKLCPFLQSCKLLFENDSSQFSKDRLKVVYAATYLGGEAAIWFNPYLNILDNSDPHCILNNWDAFEQQLFSMFGDPNEVRNAKLDMDRLVMKDNHKAPTYVAKFRAIQTQINWNDSALAFQF